MARLESMAKMGYYPTPQELIPTIARHLKPKDQGLIRIIDPCAGEGTALKTIGEHLQAETYGIEIDKKRGREAQKKPHQMPDHRLQIHPDHTEIRKPPLAKPSLRLGSKRQKRLKDQKDTKGLSSEKP